MGSTSYDEVDKCRLIPDEDLGKRNSLLALDSIKQATCVNNNCHKRVHPVGFKEPSAKDVPDTERTHLFSITDDLPSNEFNFAVKSTTQDPVGSIIVEKDEVLLADCASLNLKDNDQYSQRINDVLKKSSDISKKDKSSTEYLCSSEEFLSAKSSLVLTESEAFSDITGSKLLLNVPGVRLTPPLAVLTMNLSFCGAGFLGIYHLGVAKALVTHGQRFMINVQNFSGASAGILVAAVLAIKGANHHDIDRSTQFTMDLAEKARRKTLGVLTPRFSLLRDLEVFLHELCPPDGHVVASGRLHVSLTRLRGNKNVVVSQFTDKEHLIQCLLASSYIPFVTGHKIYTINGVKYIDGGLTDNLPRLDVGRTVTVSPFCGRESICPRDSYKPGLFMGRFTDMGNVSMQISKQNAKRGLHAFFPNNPECLQSYFARGFQDACNFLRNEGFYNDAESS